MKRACSVLTVITICACILLSGCTIAIIQAKDGEKFKIVKVKEDEPKAQKKLAIKKENLHSKKTILQAQKYLNDMGIGGQSILIDGKMGPQTQKALEEFQKYFSIPITGKLDSATWERLQKEGNRK